MSTQTSIRLLVIGAGPAGYPAAFHAADLGMSVTLVDLDPHMGGVCLQRGCIPSKALLHVARFIEECREFEQLGVRVGTPTIELTRLRDWKQSVIRRLTDGLASLCAARRIEFIQGRAQFVSPDEVEIQTPHGTRRMPVDHVLIATGSRPASLPGWPTSPRIMDSTAALDLPDIPKRLLVVGGGYIGLELGSIYAALGSRVSVVELTDGLLPGVDRTLVTSLQRRLGRRFEHIRLRTRVAAVMPEADSIRVTLEGPDGTQEETFDRVLVSVGRRPNSQQLGLDRAGIEVDARGFIRVDERRRTSHPRVWAAGDVAGEPMLAHKATYEAKIAVEAIAGRKVAYEPRTIPAVVFTDPEIAWAGLTQSEAERASRPVHIVRFPWSASGRALTLERTEGLTQWILEPESQRVLGVGIVGVNAGDLLAEGALAIELGAVADDVAWTIHAHPTLSETLMEAAELASGHATHYLPSPRT